MNQQKWKVYCDGARKRKAAYMKQDRDQLYLIQLFDYNCGSCSSGVTEVFTDDIEDFSGHYLELEKDSVRKDRFLRSRSGEIVTDYYSDSPELNIVQLVDVTDCGCAVKCRTDQTFAIANGYGVPTNYFFEAVCFEIRWIYFRNMFYKLVRPCGFGCCKESMFIREESLRKIDIYGNPFWLYQHDKEVPFASADREAYSNTVLTSYVWQVADRFATEDELRKDMDRGWLLKRQISKTFADLPGDAG